MSDIVTRYASIREDEDEDDLVRLADPGIFTKQHAVRTLHTLAETGQAHWDETGQAHWDETDDNE